MKALSMAAGQMAIAADNMVRPKEHSQNKLRELFSGTSRGILVKHGKDGPFRMTCKNKLTKFWQLDCKHKKSLGCQVQQWVYPDGRVVQKNNNKHTARCYIENGITLPKEMESEIQERIV